MTMPHAAQPKLADNVVEELGFGDDDPTRSHAEASRSLAAALGIATGLKPFPMVLRRALSLLADLGTPVARVVELVERDPALGGRLLRVANSAMFAPTHPCTSIADAVIRLGNRNVADIIAGIAVFGMFADATGAGARVRDHSAGAAAVARVLAVEWRYTGSEYVFLSALMHDVGELLMLQAGVYNDALAGGALTSDDALHLAERRELGYDHAILGAHVLEYWQFPREVARVVAWHHQPGRAFADGGDVALAVALVRLADRIDTALAASATARDEVLAQLAADEAAQYAALTQPLIAAMWPKLARARSEALSALK